MLPSNEGEYVCERKFAGPRSALDRAIAILEGRCAHDDLFYEGTVNSIYFDTPRFSSFVEKDDGDNLKTKIRLRWYGCDETLPPAVDAFLEIKARVGSARRKERIGVMVPRELVAEAPFEAPDLGVFLLSQLDRLALPSPLSWRPVCRISYQRRRYFDAPTSSRVSIDWDIRAGRVNRSLFPAAPETLSLDSVVCEYKNRLGEPPAWAEEMCIAGLAFGSFSKYGEIMSRLLGN